MLYQTSSVVSPNLPRQLYVCYFKRNLNKFCVYIHKCLEDLNVLFVSKNGTYRGTLLLLRKHFRDNFVTIDIDITEFELT